MPAKSKKTTRAVPPAAAYSRTRELYRDAFRRHGVAPAALLVSGPQHERFGILTSFSDMNHASILDVGCGFADFADTLLKRWPDAHYTGLELVPELAAIARKNHPGLEILDGTIENVAPKRRFDYVIESSIFNTGTYTFELMEQNLRAMYARATRAVAANFLSPNSTNPFNPDAAYYDPADLATLAARLTRRFTIKHDYRDNDCTLILWRDAKHPGLETEPGLIKQSGIRRPKASPVRKRTTARRTAKR